MEWEYRNRYILEFGNFIRSYRLGLLFNLYIEYHLVVQAEHQSDAMLITYLCPWKHSTFATLLELELR